MPGAQVHGRGWGLPLQFVAFALFPFPFFMKNIFLGRVLGVRFGVGLIVDTFPLGGKVVPGRWVPFGWCYFFLCCACPGGGMGVVIGVLWGKKVGNLSRRICTVKCVSVWKWIVRTSIGSFKVTAVCCHGPFMPCLWVHTS